MTELLRKLLEERGLGCQTHHLHAFWCVGPKLYEAVDNLDGTLTVGNLTPEQAIAATLGVGECAQCAKDMGAYADSLCDPLKERINKLLRCLEHDWNISASWDGLRKFWNIELTEEGVKLRDATHGTLTAKQVRDAIIANTYPEQSTILEFNDSSWQAIADELNATLGSGTCEVEYVNEWMGWHCKSCDTLWQGLPDQKPSYCMRCGKAVKR